MNVKVLQSDHTAIAIVQSDKLLITDAQSALDLIATVGYETECERMILEKAAITEDFFRLSTGLAGEILQKFVNYNMKLAIVGDFSHYASKPLKDFMYESNQGRHVFFVPDEESAIEKLTIARSER